MTILMSVPSQRKFWANFISVTHLSKIKGLENNRVWVVRLSRLVRACSVTRGGGGIFRVVNRPWQDNSMGSGVVWVLPMCAHFSKTHPLTHSTFGIPQTRIPVTGPLTRAHVWSDHDNPTLTPVPYRLPLQSFPIIRLPWVSKPITKVYVVLWFAISIYRGLNINLVGMHVKFNDQW